MGTKVYLDAKTAPAGAVTNATYPGQTQSGLLPPACKLFYDDCWKEAVRNGTVRFVATTAIDGNQPTRSVTVAFYKTVSKFLSPPGTVVYCQKMFFADTGTRSNQLEDVENGCIGWALTYLVGNSLGAILQQRNPTTGELTCWQKHYRADIFGWVEDLTDCP